MGWFLRNMAGWFCFTIAAVNIIIQAGRFLQGVATVGEQMGVCLLITFCLVGWRAWIKED